MTDSGEENTWLAREAEYKHSQQNVIDAGRHYLEECPNARADNQAVVLQAIGEQLMDQKHLDDAIPILKRCITFSPEDSACWEKLAWAQSRLCNFDEAEKGFKKVIEIGSFTETNAEMVTEAKGEINLLASVRKSPTIHDNWNCPADNGGSKVENEKANQRLGTGFFVNEHGYILTNNHVVEGCTSISTRDGDALTIVERRPRSDLALLKSSVTPAITATLRNGTYPQKGDTVITFGFPLPGILSSGGNVSTGIISATNGIGDDAKFIQISAPVQPGSSGGPVLDKSGNLIGVVVSKLDSLELARLTGDVPQNVSFAIHWMEIKSFLDEAGIKYHRAVSQRPLDTRTIAERAEKYSIGIICVDNIAK